MTKYASGKKALAICDRCGGTFKLVTLRRQYVKQRDSGLLVCRACLDIDHPQLMLGTTPVYDPQALRNPRPDTGLDVSRSILWGWKPVMGMDIVGSIGTVRMRATYYVTGVACVGAVGTVNAYVISARAVGVSGFGDVSSVSVVGGAVVPAVGVHCDGFTGSVDAYGYATVAAVGVPATGAVGAVSVAAQQPMRIDGENVNIDTQPIFFS